MGPRSQVGLTELSVPSALAAQRASLDFIEESRLARRSRSDAGDKVICARSRLYLRLTVGFVRAARPGMAGSAEAHLTEEVREARVFAQWLEDGIGGDLSDDGDVICDCDAELAEGFVVVVQPHADEGQGHGWDVG